MFCIYYINKTSNNISKLRDCFDNIFQSKIANKPWKASILWNNWYNYIGILQIKLRFENLKDLIFTSLLDFKKFFEYATKMPDDLIVSLKKNYEKYFVFLKLLYELAVFYNSENYSNMHIQEIRKYN